MMQTTYWDTSGTALHSSDRISEYTLCDSRLHSGNFLSCSAGPMSLPTVFSASLMACTASLHESNHYGPSSDTTHPANGDQCLRKNQGVV